METSVLPSQSRVLSNLELISSQEYFPADLALAKSRNTATVGRAFRVI